jgi:anti-anti-sigma factor
MADIKVEKKGKETTLIVNGEMTITYAGALRDALIKSLENAERVILDLEDVTAVDLSCLQLLCSAHRTSVQAEKSVELKSAPLGVLKQVACEAGYSRNFGCLPKTENTCFWKGI